MKNWPQNRLGTLHNRGPLGRLVKRHENQKVLLTGTKWSSGAISKLAVEVGMAEAAKYWVGFDLGGTKMLATLFDNRLKPLARERRKTKGHEGMRAGIQRIIDTIHETLQSVEVAPEKIAGIGVGCPGAVDLDRGVILESANLGWKDARLKDRLASEFGCPVVILNDVDAGLYAEYRCGAARDARCVLGVFPGTGIGGACIYNGQIFRGKRFSCLEIGHLQIRSDGHLCGCGRTGCLETEASRLAIAAEAARAAYRGEAPNLLRIAGTDLAKIRSGALADSIRAGDLVVERIVRRAASFIGVAIGNVINLLAPDVVVLGGGLVEAMPELFVPTIQEEVQRRAMSTFSRSVRIVVARLGDDANVIGAAAWAESNSVASA